MIIKNREEVIKELAEMLLQFDKDLNTTRQMFTPTMTKNNR